MADSAAVTNITQAVQATTLNDGQRRQSLYAERYPDNRGSGSQGKAVLNVRTNFFNIDLESLPDSLYTYSISFEQINGRDLKNKNVKRQLIQQLLQAPPSAASSTNIATDWMNTLVSRVDLENEPGATFDTAVKPAQKDVVVAFQNQAQPGQTTNLTIRVQRTNVLRKTDLARFLSRSKDGYFDCSLWLSAVNIISRKRVADRAVAVKVGSDKFFPLATLNQIWPSGLQPLNGYFSSVRPVFQGLALNIHNVATAFIVAQPLMDFVEAYDGNPIRRNAGVQNSDVVRVRGSDAAFKSIAKQLEVRYMYTPPDRNSPSPQRSPQLSPARAATAGRLRRINGFGRSARSQTFQLDDTTISVEDYFNKHVLLPNHGLRYPHLLVCNTGSVQAPVWVPSELLYIEPHQAKQGMLQDSDMSRMVSVAQRSPAQNQSQIAQSLQIGRFFDHQQFRQQAHLHVSTKMLEVRARMLDIPDLLYRDQRQPVNKSALREGRWDLRGRQFISTPPPPLGAIGVIVIGSGPEHVGTDTYLKFARVELAKYGIPAGANARQAPKRHSADASPASLGTAWAALQNECSGLRVVLVILASDSVDDYSRVKAWGDTISGAHTICILPTNARKLSDPQFAANIALKVNVKLGGRNHLVRATAFGSLHPKSGGSTMVVGADVTLPGAGSVPHCPSIAGLVASHDRGALMYPGSLRLQKSKQEVIEDLADMIKERLKCWHKSSSKDKDQGALPRNILFYRDGVSESQFASVKQVELPRIRAGCAMAARELKVNTYEPKITIVVCTKRHHTRFFPPENKLEEKDQWMVDGNGNFKPGLVVDDPYVRGPWHFDFYLQSQRALKGTAQPCHYFVLHNEMELPPDNLQAITFGLCWSFPTALTPISYAAPAYNADRLCDRGRCYLRPLLVLRHDQRPRDDTLAAHMATMPGYSTATDDQKDDWFCREVANGFGGYWPANRANPQADRLADKMFYV